MTQEKADAELFARLATLMADERRHLLALLEKGTILECHRHTVHPCRECGKGDLGVPDCICPICGGE